MEMKPSLAEQVCDALGLDAGAVRKLELVFDDRHVIPIVRVEMFVLNPETRRPTINDNDELVTALETYELVKVVDDDR